MKADEVAAGASYTASLAGAGIGAWFSTNWLQVLSALAILATLFLQWYFGVREDRRKSERHIHDMRE